MDGRELLEILEKSIKQFYKQDSYLIDDTHKVHEQAIVHRIAHYFENIVDAQEPDFYKEYNFDVEYNKNLKGAKEIFSPCWQCPEFKCNCKCYVESQESRPDFLIHKRGNNSSNQLIVEFKTGSNSSKKDIKYDMNKVQYFTCPHGEYKYFLGCFVYIDEKRYTIKIFQEGKEVRLTKKRRKAIKKL